MMLIYLFAGILIGFIIGWLIARNKTSSGLETNATAAEELISLRTKLSLMDQQKMEQDTLLKAEQEKVLQANGALKKAESDIEHLNRQLENSSKELEAMHQRMTTEFENLANKILEDKSARFAEQNRVNLDVILNPLKEKIKDFESKVEIGRAHV